MKIGIVGLGYVGLPLAIAFCEAGHEVVGVDTDPRVADALALRAARQGRRDHRGRPHAAHAQPRARPSAADRLRDRTRGRAAGRAAGGARVHHVSRHHARPVRVAAGGVRPRRGARLLRGLLAGAHRPGPHRPHDAHHPEGGRRPHRRMPAAGGRAVQRGLRRDRGGLHAGGGGAHEAARERLPLGEHRPGERAGDPLRPHGDRRLGGHRRRGDQALRVHVVQARARHGRPLPARGPLLPGLAGARVRHADRVHRARRRGEPAHAVLLRRADRAGAERPREIGARLRIGIFGVSYKPGVGDLRESPALRIIRLLREQGAEVVYHDDFVPELPEHGLHSNWPDDVDCAVIVTAHPGLDLERVVRESPLVVDFRGVTRGIEASNLVRL